MPNVEPVSVDQGQKHDPGMWAQSIIDMAASSVSGLADADVDKRIRDLGADINKAWEQSEHGKDISKIEGMGSSHVEICETLQRLNCERKGLLNAKYERAKENVEKNPQKYEGLIPSRHTNVALHQDVIVDAASKGYKDVAALYEANAKQELPHSLHEYRADVTMPDRITYLPGVTPSITRTPPTAYDFLFKFQSNRDAIRYWIESLIADADPRQAGGALTESDVTLEEKTATFKEVGHYIPATEEDLTDKGMLEQVINESLRSGVVRAMDKQLIAGTGAGAQMKGLMNVDDIQTSPLFTVSGGKLDKSTVLDELWEAVQAFETNTENNCFGKLLVLHNDMYTKIFGFRTDGNGFAFGDPTMPFGTVVFGIPVVKSMRLEADGVSKVMGLLIDNAPDKIQLAERWGVTVRWGMFNDDLIKLKRTGIAFQRASLIVRQPKAIMELKTKAS